MNAATVVMLCVMVWGCAVMASEPTQADAALIAHWPLAGDCKDHSGHGHHGKARAIDFACKGPTGKLGTAARFDGCTSVITIKPSPELALGTRDFALSAWVHTADALDDVLGDIVSKYDPARRTGLNLNIKIAAGVTSTQANYRHVEFGIDNGRAEKTWTDCGRPGEAVFICALATFDGHLYAGTYESGADKVGHIYRYDGGTTWTDCGSPSKANSIFCLAEYNGKLYAGAAAYRARGSALEDSPNMTPGGHVYRYEGGKRWADCGRLGDADEVYALAVYKGKLYAIPMYSPGVFEYDGAKTWKYIGTPGGQRSMALAVWNGHLYNTGNGGAGVWQWAGGERWIDCGKQAKETQTYSVIIYDGKLHTATWPTGSVFRYEGGTRWRSIGRLGEEMEVMGVAVYNGKMYGGTLPLGQVYRCDGDDDWTLIDRLDHTPDVKYRRVWSMATYRGRLFAGTLPSGHVHSWEAGRCVTYDHALEPGWRHIGAVRDGDRLRLYVDGKAIATSSTFKPADFDLTNDRPLLIGFGPNDHFYGAIADVRLYGRSLDAGEMRRLAAAGRND